MNHITGIYDHPDEFWPLVKMAYAAKKAKKLPKGESLAFCYDMLNKVSRSFAIVIQQLPEELRDPVCIFYLVLRALDTVEDDMAVPKEVKIPLLNCFHEKIYERGWTFQCGYGNYVRLMDKYPLVTDVFLGLKEPYQKVIADITRRMGQGMAEFIVKEVVSVADYDKYCHYVAGLVGIGLSQLFASSKLESPDFATAEALSNDMGLFLQKTNIIRDYLEDINELPAPRMFWPREIWGQYGESLDSFKEPENSKVAVKCLNHLVMDALRHAERCLEYMSRVKNGQIFRFCAIPQVMAIGTLAMCYNNHGVFTGVVKMRRGEVAKYMLALNGLPDLYVAFLHFASILAAKCRFSGDENAKATLARIKGVQKVCREGLKNFPQVKLVDDRVQEPRVGWGPRAAMLTGSGFLFAYAFGLGGLRPEFGDARWSATTPSQYFIMFTATLFLVITLIYIRRI